jgi:hypothetical protein
VRPRLTAINLVGSCYRDASIPCFNSPLGELLHRAIDASQLQSFGCRQSPTKGLVTTIYSSLG